MCSFITFEDGESVMYVSHYRIVSISLADVNSSLDVGGEKFSTTEDFVGEDSIGSKFQKKFWKWSMKDMKCELHSYVSVRRLSHCQYFS